MTAGRLQEGVILIIWGLYKKMVIADGLARFVDPVFSRPEAHAGPAVLIAIYAFSLQIFADFSGYTDIARGTGKILGVDLMENFRKPYFAYSIQDFWRRCISLFPLGCGTTFMFPWGATAGASSTLIEICC